MLEIGARVAYRVGIKAILGVITQETTNIFTIQQDNGHITQVSDASRIYKVDYWKDRLSPRDFNKLRTFDNSITMLDIFNKKIAIVFGPAAMRAMWYWANLNVFGDLLKPPQFVTSTKKTGYGSFRNTRQGIILASTRNHSRYELFNTMLHEMVHQYNWQVDFPEGKFRPLEGAHGNAFRRWIPIIQEKTGVRIQERGDINENDAEFFDPQEEPSTAPFIYILINSNNGWIGFQAKNREALDQFRPKARQLLQQIAAHDNVIYAGWNNLQRVRGELYKVSNGPLRPNMIKSYVSPAILRLLRNTARPIEGYQMLPAVLGEK